MNSLPRNGLRLHSSRRDCNDSFDRHLSVDFFRVGKKKALTIACPSVVLATLGLVLRRTAFAFLSFVASRNAIFDGRPYLIPVNSDVEAKNRQIQYSRHDPYMAIYELNAIQFTK